MAQPGNIPAPRDDNARGDSPLARLNQRGVALRAHREVHNAVLEFQSPTAELLATPVPQSARGTVWIVGALVASCGAAMFMIPIDKVVTAQGRVTSQAPTLVVQPLETSIVRAINVREGQAVHKGDLLAQLDPTFAAADMGSSGEQTASLKAEVARLRAELADQPYKPTEQNSATELQLAVFAQRAAAKSFMLENYQQKIDSLKAMAQKAAADLQGYQQRLHVAVDLEAKRRELERLQVGSQINRLQATDNRIEIQRGLADAQNTLQGSIRDLRAQIAQRDNYVQQWRADTAQTLTEQDRKLSDAQEQLAKAHLRHDLVDLRADQDAVVLTVAKVSVGSVLQSGDQFLTLVPMNAPLEVEANIPGSEAGYVGVGDKVTVKFDTFPYVRYGYADGTVRTVSSDSFSADTPQARSGTQRAQMAQPTTNNEQVFYRAHIQLDHIGLHDTPAGFHVMPGMPVTADIKVGKRTVMDYLLSRLLPAAMDGMREP